MELNKDCVRDLMLYVEENVNYGESIYTRNERISEALGYDKMEVSYITKKLKEGGHLEVEEENLMGASYETFLIKDITYQGHLFLDNIRDDEVWKKTKEKIGPLKSVSIEIVSRVATEVVCRQLGI